MEAYSLDLRERICAACDEHLETREEVAERFGVSRSFVQKLLRRRVFGSIAAKPKGGGLKPAINNRDRRRLRELVKDKPDARLDELCAALSAGGGPAVSVWTMCRTLQALRLPLKKRRFMRRSGTRRACERYADTGRSGSERWTRPNWSSWTRAGSILQ